MKFNKRSLNSLLTYFIRGLLLIVPFALTGYIISLALNWIDGLVKIKIPGLGLAILLSAITLFGYLASSWMVRSLFDWIEKLLIKIPLINLIYTSLKELMAAFVGNKKKFDKPVLVTLNWQEQIFKLGFITQSELQQLDLPGKVAVYLPHSYNFSGELCIIPKENIQPLALSGTEVMKFIVSGGVAGLQYLEDNETNRPLA
ncbi:MAG: DUF502 domain-containing protein [Burkholderiales bacterium]